MTNPWLGLAASSGGNDASTSEVRENKRRSFTPEELDNYKHAFEAQSRGCFDWLVDGADGLSDDGSRRFAVQRCEAGR
jgi:hypothetical protein